MAVNIKKFAEFVLRRRNELGLTQLQVATLAKVTKTAISYLESVKVQDVAGSTLIGLAKALQWSPEQIFMAYEGEDPSQIKYDPAVALQTLATDAVMMLNHLPPEVMLEAMRQIDPKLLAELLIRMNGEEAIRQDLEEAKRRHREKKKTE